MIKIKSDCVAYIILFSLVFALPLYGCAQNIADRKPLIIARNQKTQQEIPPTAGRKPLVVASTDIPKPIIKK